MRTYVSSIPSALVFLLLVSCKTQRDNPNHCQNQNGNDWCAEQHTDGSLPYCAIGACMPDAIDGCVADRPTDNACYSPCGDDQTFEDDPSCDGIADTGTDPTTLTSSMSDTTPTATTDDPTLTTSMSMSASESETEVTSETDPTTGPTGCVSSLECTDPGSPVCVDEVCSPCGDAADGDAACEAKDPLTPACRDDGECVQCTPANASECGDVTPICGGSSTCVGCTEHAQCAAGACLLDTGACFDEGCMEDVFAGEDIANVIADGCVIRVHAGVYAETLTISGDTVALLAAGDGDAAITGVDLNGAASLSVTGSATVYVEGLLINSNDAGGIGVEVDGAFVWMDRTQVVANTGGGIALTGGAEVHVRNGFVSGANGASPAIDVTAGNVEVLYSTLGGIGLNAVALSCGGRGSADIRNSILVAEDDVPELACVGATVSNSATEGGVAGAGNVAVDDMDADWFGNFLGGNYLLTEDGAPIFAGIAVWETGDPEVDINSDPRPTDNGTADFAGADLVP